MLHSLPFPYRVTCHVCLCPHLPVQVANHKLQEAHEQLRTSQRHGEQLQQQLAAAQEATKAAQKAAAAAAATAAEERSRLEAEVRRAERAVHDDAASAATAGAAERQRLQAEVQRSQEAVRQAKEDLDSALAVVDRLTAEVASAQGERGLAEAQVADMSSRALEAMHQVACSLLTCRVASPCRRRQAA